MELRKPPAVRPGDCIGIVATSSPVSRQQLVRLTGYLKGRGYTVRLAEGILERSGYLAGSADHRAAGVMSMFEDPDVALVLPATGGTGAAHLIDLLDYPLIQAHPKVFAGFSNPTALNNSILAAAGLPSIHGLSGFQFFQPEINPWTEAAFWATVSGSIAGQEVAGHDWHVHRADGLVAAGPAIGGNLAALRPLIGTRWMPATAGGILLIEAMTATFEEVDDALTHLRLAGIFDEIAALLIGAPADWPHAGAPDADVDELVLRCVGGGFPVVTNVGFGHQPRRIQFPIGCRVEIDTRGSLPVLRYLEDLVQS